MKKYFLKGSILAGVIALFMGVGVKARIVDNEQTGFVTVAATAEKENLPSITKPYLGEYECEKAQFGGRDILENFSYIRLELKLNGECVVRAKNKDGKTHQRTGKYAYDEKTQEIAFSLGKTDGIKRKFALKDGKIEIVFTAHGKSFYMQFTKK